MNSSSSNSSTINASGAAAAAATAANPAPTHPPSQSLSTTSTSTIAPSQTAATTSGTNKVNLRAQNRNSTKKQQQTLNNVNQNSSNNNNNNNNNVATESVDPRKPKKARRRREKKPKSGGSDSNQHQATAPVINNRKQTNDRCESKDNKSQQQQQQHQQPNTNNNLKITTSGQQQQQQQKPQQQQQHQDVKLIGGLPSPSGLNSPTTKSVVVSVLNAPKSTAATVNNKIDVRNRLLSSPATVSTATRTNNGPIKNNSSSQENDNLATNISNNSSSNTFNNNNNNIITSLDTNNSLEMEFDKNYVFRRRKNAKPNDPPRYRCNLCNYFCDSVDIARKHIIGTIHKNNMDTINLEKKVRDLAIPSSTRLDCLSAYLADFYSKNVISRTRLDHAYEIFERFRTKLAEKYKNQYEANMIGSMSYGVCFNDSQCDISIEPSPPPSGEAAATAREYSPMTIMRDVVELLRTEMSECLCDLETRESVNRGGSGDKPSSNRIAFKSASNGLVFNFLTGLYPSAYKTSTLLRAYLDLDERARLLAFAFRYMSKIAQIDRSDFSTLPSHAYVIMTIYFLQHLKPPVLPVLHEIIDFRTISPTQINGHNHHSNNNNSKNKNAKANRTKKQKIRNPNRDQDESENSEDDDNELQPDDENDDDESINNLDFRIFETNLANYVNSSKWKSSNKDSIGSLWLKLLAFYSVDFGFRKYMISIRRQARVPKSSLKMYSKKMCVEDPFYLKQNLSKSLITQTNKYIVNVISKTCLSFVFNTHSINIIEPTNSEKLLDCVASETGIIDAKKWNRGLESVLSGTEEDEEDENEEEVDRHEEETESTSEPSSSRTTTNSSDSDVIDDDDDVIFKSLEDDFNKKLDVNNKPGKKHSSHHHHHSHEKNTDREVKRCLDFILDQVVASSNEIGREKKKSTPPNIALKTLDSNSKKNLPNNLNTVFKFTQNSLGILKSPPKICSHCNKEGHLQFECPQDQLPKLENLPEMSPNWRQVLDKVFECIYEDNRQTREEEKLRGELLDEIKRIVWQKYPNARLSLFGSSNNGFAMKKSDLDICMTLDNRLAMDEEINYKRIIRNLGALFRRESDFDQIEERVSAKVPIVKFRHRKSMIEGDISLYNTLALQNTDLLRTYAQIDERTKTLGYVVKHFAKVCRIGDASCGSLSSYAYIVMMIHYLMNTDPPVLPCLQKLNRDRLPAHTTSLIIDGWDCWFNRLESSSEANNDEQSSSNKRLTHKQSSQQWKQQLSSHWPHVHANKQSVGELWLGFLRYYTEKFDWNEHVVCIRQPVDEPLTRKQKNWTKHRLAIEDPFELSHNLAAGVSHKMGLYILKCFAKARYIFGMCLMDFRPDETRLNINYFFNPQALVDGSPPMDRNCYSCFKIGHQTRDCPLANAKRREKQRDNLDGNNQQLASSLKTDDSNLQCFRCRQYGHRAKECPGNGGELLLRRQKTVSVSISDYYAAPQPHNVAASQAAAVAAAHFHHHAHHHHQPQQQPPSQFMVAANQFAHQQPAPVHHHRNRCYICSQPGHTNRECPHILLNYHLNQQQQQQQQFNNSKQQEQQQAAKFHYHTQYPQLPMSHTVSQSAPAPKMISSTSSKPAIGSQTPTVSTNVNNSSKQASNDSGVFEFSTTSQSTPVNATTASSSSSPSSTSSSTTTTTTTTAATSTPTTGQTKNIQKPQQQQQQPIALQRQQSYPLPYPPKSPNNLNSNTNLSHYQIMATDPMAHLNYYHQQTVTPPNSAVLFNNQHSPIHNMYTNYMAMPTAALFDQNLFVLNDYYLVQQQQFHQQSNCDNNMNNSNNG